MLVGGAQWRRLVVKSGDVMYVKEDRSLERALGPLGFLPNRIMER